MPLFKTNRSHKRSILPGFGLTLGFTMFYLGLVVLVPLSAIYFKSAVMGWSEVWRAVTEPRVLAGLRLSFVASLTAAAINALFGFVTAWALVRYEFPGRRLVDGLVDLPFAMPTAVSGIALCAIFAPNGWIGSHLETIGVKAAFNQTGIIIALVFIGIPFVVRTVQPVLEDIDRAVEEAGASLGADRMQIFRRLLLPQLVPSLVIGFSLAFSRAVGEYGSVIFISGNLPFQTEIAPLLIVGKLEQYDYPGAAAIALVMLVVSFFLLLVLNVGQWLSGRRAV